MNIPFLKKLHRLQPSGHKMSSTSIDNSLTLRSQTPQLMSSVVAGLYHKASQWFWIWITHIKRLNKIFGGFSGNRRTCGAPPVSFYQPHSIEEQFIPWMPLLHSSFLSLKYEFFRKKNINALYTGSNCHLWILDSVSPARAKQTTLKTEVLKTNCKHTCPDCVRTSTQLPALWRPRL